MTNEEKEKMVNEFMDSIDWVKTYKMFLKVKEINDCVVIHEKTPNQFRRWVEDWVNNIVNREDFEVGYWSETNCVRICCVEEGWLEMSFTAHVIYENENDEY
jgi:hypothetical protein